MECRPKEVVPDALTKIQSVDAQSAALGSFEYNYNTANQRTSVTNADGSRWVYTYDSLGQVTSGKKVWSDGTAVAGQQFDYAYDDIGNRKTTASGGDQFGNNQRTESYTPTILNHYTNRTVASYLQVMGSANSSAKVTVNNTQTSRKGDYWRAELPVNNTTGAVWLQVTNTAVMVSGSKDAVTNTIGSELIAKTPETFIHDADGNLIQDGQWVNTWDAENRLLSQETSPSAYASGAPILHLQYEYEPGFRRIAKRVYLWDGSDWILQTALSFAYDGWNLIGELNPTNNSLLRGYTWGTDLSGTMQGAGGVGGLLKMADTSKAPHEHYFYQIDGSGNVSCLVDNQAGAKVAQYEYDSFGNDLRAPNSQALNNPFRFSTKYLDHESGHIYYGYRYYDSAHGAWLSKDLLGEQDGANIYGFCKNNPGNAVDIDGLQIAFVPRISPILEPVVRVGPSEAVTATGGVRPVGPSLTPPVPATPNQPHLQGPPNPNAPQFQQDQEGQQAPHSGDWHVQLGSSKKLPYHRGYWRRQTPLTKSQGLERLDVLWNSINRGIQADLKDEFDAARKWVRKLPATGVQAFRLFSWPKSGGRCWHLDVEIVTGTAFVDDPPRGPLVDPRLFAVAF